MSIPSSAKKWLVPSLITGTALLLLVWSWGKWPDVLVDFGRELYLAWQLSEGQVLYRDLAYFNGPLSPYLNSFLFRIFGVGFRTLVVTNLVILTLITAILYHLLKRISNRFSATTASLCFITLFAFSQFVGIGNYNFVCPYSHEMTHGIALSLMAFAGLSLYQRTGKMGGLAAAGLCFGLVFLTRAEISLATALASATFLTLILVDEPALRRRWQAAVGTFAASAVVPSLVTWGLFCLAMPPEQAWRGILGNWPHVWSGSAASLPFFRASMGTLDIGDSLGKLIFWLAAYLLVLVPVAGLGLLLRTRGAHRGWITVGVVVLVGLLSFFAKELPVEDLFRPLPVLMVFLGIAAARGWIKARRHKETQNGNPLRIALILWAFVLLGKTILNARIQHYGFALAMPATLLLVVALVGWIPSWLETRKGFGPIFRWVSLALLGVVVIGHLRVMDQLLAEKSLGVGEGADHFIADWRGEAVNAALRELSGRLEKGETLAVLPEGAMLNYLSRQANSTPHSNFMPTEMAIFGEDGILDSFLLNPPDYIALVHKDTSEFGFRLFGRDYGRRLAAWIRENYQPVVLIGAAPLQDDRFGIEILVKNVR